VASVAPKCTRVTAAVVCVHIANSASHEKNCTGTSSRMRCGIWSMSATSVFNMPLRNALLTSSKTPHAATPPASTYNIRSSAKRATSTTPSPPTSAQRSPRRLVRYALPGSTPADSGVASAKPCRVVGGYSRVDTMVQRMAPSNTTAPMLKA